MWPVRSRRGTCKRFAALFVVGVCAAIMIITRPFITTQPSLPMPLVPEPLISAAVASSNASYSSPALNDTTTEHNNGTPLVFQPLSTEKNNQAPPPPPVSIAIRPEFIQEPQVEVVKPEEASDANRDAENFTPAGSPAPVAVTSTQQQPMSSGPVMAAPPTASGNVSVGGEFPIVYVITPTFPRMEQMAELTRLSQTLMLIKDLHWLVVDDAPSKSKEVETLLKRTSIPYTYLVAQMPDKYRKKKGSKPKGVANRLAGLKWITEHARDNGVMYFADDDNSYDMRLFEEMRWTKRVSMWPVGLVTQLGVSTPVVKNGRVIDFYDGWISTRKFPVDMAGFAVNVGFLKSRPNATMPYKAGYEEDGFLRSLSITNDDIEPKADNCTKILVWHTKTVGNKSPQKISAKDRKRFNSTNLFSLPHIV